MPRCTRRQNAAKGGRPAPPRLVRRFAAYAGAALLVAAIGAFFFVREYATRHAEQTARAHTEYIAESVLPHLLKRSDFQAPVRGRRLRQLDRLAKHELLSPGILRAKLYGPTGEVVYSTDHALIGTRTPDLADVLRALHGSPVGDTTSLDAEGGGGSNATVLESYVPVGLGGPKPAGVFELYASYGPIATDARSIFVPIALGMAVVLLGLYLSFFPILRGVTRTLRRQMHEIEHKAYHDSLTDLPNRALFHERAEESLRSAEGRGRTFAVMLIDLDGFKDVNDTLGHDSGDRLLQALATALPAELGPHDTVARLGGDEFGIVVADGRDTAALLALAETLRGTITRHRLIDGIELAVDAGIGIARYPRDGLDVKTLVRRADVALYRSKETHAPTLYDKEYDHYSSARLGLVAELHHAIENRELAVAYQPQCDPESGALRSVEALVRWRHPKRGLLMPEAFIPLAEHTGAIRELTDHVIDAALSQCHRWQQEGFEVPVAVNVSARDLLDARFPAGVARMLRRREVDPSRLELEITEKTAINDLPRAKTVLDRLRALGVRLAIDDFGTGNSSLAYFRHLPVDRLKIDRSYVTGMLENPDDLAIVRSTIQLAHDLQLCVVAEGVEDLECNRHLKDLGCDLAQGFYFGKPMSAEEISDRWLEPVLDPAAT